jgi:predicted nicotinamide N-methyase
VWACSLVFARWVVALQAKDPSLFSNRKVMELGAGTGVPGLTALLYTAATHVTFTDLFKHTMDNLAFNVDANLKTASPGRTKDNTEVCVYDWVKYTSLAAGSFDVILGSDLVYDIAAAELLTQVIEHLLTPTGTFLMVAGEGRQGVPELQAKMETHGFVVTQSPAPEEYMANPLVSQDNAELQLHFNELEDNKFHLYTFRRSSKSGCVPNKLPTFERPYQPLFMCLHMCSHLAVELCANNLRYFSHADGVAMPTSPHSTPPIRYHTSTPTTQPPPALKPSMMHGDRLHC